jgi:hypothetical protein
VRRIALLFAYDEGNSEVQGWLATFRDGLAKLGWVEGPKSSLRISIYRKRHDANGEGGQGDHCWRA